VEKRLRSEADRSRVLEAYQASGLSVRAFAAQAGIAKGTLYTWVSKSRQQSTAEAQGVSPVRMAKVLRRSEPPILKPDTSSMTLEWGSARIHVGASFHPAALTALLDVLEARAQGSAL
jgi:transposase-like protein